MRYRAFGKVTVRKNGVIVQVTTNKRYKPRKQKVVK